MLLQALDDAAPEPSQAAATALGHIRSSDAVPQLMTFYERGDRDAKIAALDALALSPMRAPCNSSETPCPTKTAKFETPQNTRWQIMT